MAPTLPSDEQLISICKETYRVGQRVIQLSDEITVKFGIGISSAEAATQLYAWKNANPSVIRIPEPYRFFQDESRGPGLTVGYLVMENIKGTDLSAYLKSASSLEQDTVVTYLINALNHLSAIPLPAGQGPGPVGGGPLRGYLWSDGGIGSSFASIPSMENWLNKILADYTPDLHGRQFDFTSEKLVMCHTDFAPRNILRLNDGRLALLDWGSAGFYPSIFEKYAFRTRLNREPIFAKILLRLAQVPNEESQIQLLARIEWILMRYSDAINLSVITYDIHAGAIINSRAETLATSPMVLVGASKVNL